MKKLLAYIILFSYSTMLLKPVIPSVTDLIAHTFWYAKHIATVHYENGMYHVHYQYLEESKKAFPGKNAQLIKNDNTQSDQIVVHTDYPISNDNPLLIHFLPQSSFLPHASLFKDYPPPRS